jgi:acetate kinase
VRVLALNAGSSSLKASVIEHGRRSPVAATSVGWGSDSSRMAGRADTIRQTLADLAAAGVETDSLEAVGHRMVHGGTRFRQPVAVDESVLSALDKLSPLAPLHNSVALDTIRAARDLLPGRPHVAVFDTAFHAGLPEEAVVYPLPWPWYEEWGIRRYGFHGLSVEWSVRRAGELLGRDPGGLCLVVAHLGSGCSVTAVQDGESVATSMGYTPLEGLMMGTRAGSFDPGIALRLLADGRVTVAELAEAVDHGSGLLGVSGVSGDVREVGAAADAGDGRAALALALFVRRSAEGIAAAASSLRGLDCLVFTGGIGEHAGELRRRIAARLAVLGVSPLEGPDPVEDGVLSAPAARVAVLRVEAREDVVIAEAAAQLLAR